MSDNIISDSHRRPINDNKATKSPTKRKRSSKNNSDPVEEVKKDIALYSDGKLFDRKLGRLNKGYNIVPSEEAEEWVKISNKVRIATPEEVAMAYGE